MHLKGQIQCHSDIEQSIHRKGAVLGRILLLNIEIHRSGVQLHYQILCGVTFKDQSRGLLML